LWSKKCLFEKEKSEFFPVARVTAREGLLTTMAEQPALRDGGWCCRRRMAEAEGIRGWEVTGPGTGRRCATGVVL
jgi:hypothetical protein